MEVLQRIAAKMSEQSADAAHASLSTWTGEERYDVVRSLLGETCNEEDDNDDDNDLSVEFQLLTEGS